MSLRSLSPPTRRHDSNSPFLFAILFGMLCVLTSTREIAAEDVENRAPVGGAKAETASKSESATQAEETPKVENAAQPKSASQPETASQTAAATEPGSPRAESKEGGQEEDRVEAEVAEGHSTHGEVFNEGPRQRAVLIDGTGKVDFPCTCATTEVQQFINQGLGQLYGFWYFEAERSFRQAAAIDPDCAMAYWGMAQANGGNVKRAKGFIEEAVKRKDKVTKREQMYIDALKAYLDKDGSSEKDADKNRAQGLTTAYEKIIHEFPQDVEAKAFLGLQMYNNRGKGIPISSYFAVDALLKEVLAVNPYHPCHHFRIHLWDYEKAERALDSAALCGPSAPGVAHMWHMPGHIYSRLKRYDDAAWQQEASARVDHARMMADGLLPDQIHNFAHNNEWLIRDLIYIGRGNDALDLAKNMIDLPRHPKYNTAAKSGSASFGRTRLTQVLEEFELWEELVKLAETRYLEPGTRESDQLKRQRLIGRAHYLLGNTIAGDGVLADLQQQKSKLEAERDAELQKAEQQARDAAAKKGAINTDAQKGQETKSPEPKSPVANPQQTKPDDAKPNDAKPDDTKADAAKTEATDQQDATTGDAKAETQDAKSEKAEKPADATPGESKSVDTKTIETKADETKPDTAKPMETKPAETATAEKVDKGLQDEITKAQKRVRDSFNGKLGPIGQAIREMEGHQIRSAEKYDESLKAFSEAGQMPTALMAAAQLDAKHPDKAIDLVNKAVQRSTNQVLPLADQVVILWRAEKKDDARKAFEELRKLSAAADINLPRLAPLAPIAIELGYGADWRVEKTPAADLGPRPPLDSLGPFRWQPVAAADWTLTDAEGGEHQLSSYSGRPVVMIFYLGYGCLHCAEQLQAFAPMTADFNKRGVDLIAISTDSVKDLKLSHENYKNGTFPFPLVSDKELQVFKKYRCYDDFENKTLHGTLLFDGAGAIRWRDVSFEPFMDAKFLLDEATRLLDLKVPVTEPQEPSQSMDAKEPETPAQTQTTMAP